MKITDLTPDVYASLLAAGKVSEKDKQTWDKYQAKLVAKPSKPVPEVDISVPFVRGKFGERSFTAKTIEGKAGKFVSIRVPVNVSGASGYANADTLPKFIEGLIQIHEELVKAGYPFPTEG